jgi:beta-glucosidase
MATRILAGWYLLKQDSGYPTTNFDCTCTSVVILCDRTITDVILAWNAGKGSHVDVQGNHARYVASHVDKPPGLWLLFKRHP